VETPILVAIVTGIPGLIAAFMVFRSSGKATNVNDKAQELGWVKELRQDALDTRRELDSCQEQLQSMRRQLAAVTREAEHWISEYRFLHRTIWRDSITIDRLRETIGPPPPDTPPAGSNNGSRMIR
jgi:hypothetical protein